MKTVGLAAAVCALLALTTGCGAEVMNSASATGLTRAADAPGQAAEQRVRVVDGPGRFGERRAAGESFMISVSTPKSFVPGAAAFPQAPRAVAFEICIDNQGNRTYRPSQLLVKAMTANGQVAVQVVDSPQGYSGGAGAGEDVPPGKSLRTTLAFAVPAEQVELRVVVQPDAGSVDVRAEFEGTA